jgi:hypothetical protein
MTPAPEVKRPNAWLAFRQSVVHFDTAKMNAWLGLRNALGVALSLFAGLALHSLSGGVVAAKQRSALRPRCPCHRRFGRSPITPT